MGKPRLVLLFFVIGVFVSSFPLYAQVSQEWVSRFYGSVSGSGNLSIKADASGNVYVAGRADSSSSFWRFFLIKYGQNGNLLWSRSFYDVHYTNCGAVDMKLGSNDKIFVTCFLLDSLYKNHILTQIYNASGNLIWSDIYGEYPESNSPSAMIIDNEGSVYVCGGRNADSLSMSDFITIKYNSQGQRIWIRTYDGPMHRYDNASGIASDDRGYIYVTGRAATNTGFYDFATIKYDRDGNAIWTVHTDFSGPIGNHAYMVKVDAQHNVYVGGSYMRSIGIPGFLTAKYDSTGNLLWIKTFFAAGSGEAYIAGLVLDDSVNVYITGSVRVNNYAFKIVTIKYNSSGIREWLREYYSGDGYYGSFGNSLAIDDQRCIYVGGYSYFGPEQRDDYVLLKYDNMGNQQWIVSYDSPYHATDEAYAVCTDNNKNIYVTGYSYNALDSAYDFATIKYSQVIGVGQISSEIPSAFKLYQNYPNPFNPTTKIRFDIPEYLGRSNSNVKLTIYDILGREVAVPINERIAPGTYEINWDAVGSRAVSTFIQLLQVTIGKQRR